MSGHPLFVCGVALALVVTGACTSGGDDEPEPPAPDGAAEDFVAAWAEEDAAAMSALFDAPTRKRLTALRVQRSLNALMRTPGVAGFDVALEEVEAPDDFDDGDEASAAFTISYDVPALGETPELEGELDLTYDAGRETWEVGWEPGLLWPGVEGAVGMELDVEWPKRAPLLDRRKRP